MLPFSERVRQRLARRVWTVTAAAEDMGLDRESLSNFKNERRYAGVATLDKIVAWLDEQDSLDETARKGR